MSRAKQIISEIEKEAFKESNLSKGLGFAVFKLLLIISTHLFNRLDEIENKI